MMLYHTNLAESFAEMKRLDVETAVSRIVERMKWQTDPIAEKAREIESQFKRLNNDVNGNPRYWIHDMGFPSEFNWARFGFQSYRGKQFGGGYTVSTYNLRGKSEEMAKAVCGKDN